MVKAVIFDMYETLVTLWGQKIYMGHEIAMDAGIPEPKFREIWDATDDVRAIGKRRFEDVIEEILKVNDRYSQKMFDMIVEKRRESKRESFLNLHGEIIPMLEGLKAEGVKIGLITNCFWEEYDVIKTSGLFKYFDAVCMSCEEGIKKPDERIFRRCLDRLGLSPEDCIYCGDGGSHELQTALKIGMRPVQALWYLRDGVGQPATRMPEFEGAKTPLEIVKKVKE